jgi:hypothetical protein
MALLMAFLLSVKICKRQQWVCGSVRNVFLMFSPVKAHPLGMHKSPEGFRQIMDGMPSYALLSNACT